MENIQLPNYKDLSINDVRVMIDNPENHVKVKLNK
jgi:hypothetical protein